MTLSNWQNPLVNGSGASEKALMNPACKWQQEEQVAGCDVEQQVREGCVYYEEVYTMFQWKQQLECEISARLFQATKKAFLPCD